MRDEALSINIRIAKQLHRAAPQDSHSEAIQPFTGEKKKKLEPPKPPEPKQKDPPLPVIPIVEPIVVKKPEITTLPVLPIQVEKPPVVIPPVLILPAPEITPQTEFTVAHVGLEKALAQEIHQTQSTCKSWEQSNYDKANSLQGLLNQPSVWLRKSAQAIERKMPNHPHVAKALAMIPEYLSGFAFMIAHPVKTLWQNTILSKVYDQRDIRFGRELVMAMKDRDLKMAHMEIPPEFLAAALNEGQQRRNRNVLTRLKNAMWDATAGNLGFQSSTQRETLKWLESENSQAFREKVKALEKANLDKQMQIATSFAKHTDQIGASDLMVASEYGEKRERVTLAPALQKEINHLYKDIITRYHQHPEDRKKLLAEINLNLASENFQQHLSSEQRAFFNQPEFASNLLQIAESVHAHWADYQRPDTRPTHTGTFLDNLKFDLIVGQGEWHEARELIKVNEREHALYLELTRKDYPEGTTHLSQAMDLRQKNLGNFDKLLSRIVTNPLSAYLVGESLGAFAGSIPMAIPRMAQLIPGPIFAGVAAAWGEKSRNIAERRQVSREAAMGYGNIEHRRRELENSLVQRKSATELYNAIKPLLNAESLTAAQQKELLLFTGHLNARLRLTNLSTLNDRVQQNFIDYSEANNPELIAYCQAHHLTMEKVLRSLMIHAKEKLVASGQTITDCDESLDLYSNVVSGHLINGAKTNAQIEKALRATTTGTPEQQTRVQEILALMATHNLSIAEVDSLQKKNQLYSRYLAGQIAWMGLKTAALSAVASPILAPLNPVTAITSELSGALHHAVSGMDHTAIWSEIIHGDFHPEYNSATGRFETDLTPLQQSFVLGQNLYQQLFHSEDQPTVGATHHTVTNSEGIVQEIDIQGANPAIRFQGDALVDTRDGTILGHYDSAGHFVNDEPQIGNRLQVEINQNGTPGQELHFDPSNGFYEQDVQIGAEQNVKLQVPNGTTLVLDHHTSDGGVVYDLQANNNSQILVNDITFAADGTFEVSSPDVNHFQFSVIPESTSSPDQPEPTTTHEVIEANANEYWNDGEEVHVVHGRSTNHTAMTNYLVKATGADSETHPLAVKFLLPESEVHNPNTGYDQSLDTAFADHKAGILLQTVEVNQGGQEVTRSHFVEATGREVINGQVFYTVTLDPSDNNPAHTQGDLQAGVLARLVLNEQHLATVANSADLADNGEQALNSEMTYEGRSAFNLGHQQIGNKIIDGRILGGIKEGNEFLANHAIHGNGDPIDAQIDIVTKHEATPIVLPPEYKLELTGDLVNPGQTHKVEIVEVPIEKAFPPLGGLLTTRQNLAMAERLAASRATALAAEREFPSQPVPKLTDLEVKLANGQRTSIEVPHYYLDYLKQKKIAPQQIMLLNQVQSNEKPSIDSEDKETIRLANFEFDLVTLRETLGILGNNPLFWYLPHNQSEAEIRVVCLPLKTKAGEEVILQLDWATYQELLLLAYTEDELERRKAERLNLAKT